MQNSSSFRSPSVYVKLPSEGKYWPTGSLQIQTPTGELAVQSMTVKDEMALKTPDALMNGVAVVNVIQSCCPEIKNAWHLPQMDLDTVLVAIRIATYGESLDIKSSVPKVNQQHTFTVNLNSIMDQIIRDTFVEDHQLSDGTVIKIRPMDYRGVTNANLRNYEQARLADTVNKSNLDETQKLQKIQDAFINITNITVDNMVSQISSVKYKGEPIENIKEYVENIPAKVANEIKDKIASQKAIGTIPTQEVATPEELVAKGAPKTYPQTITLDYANFFVSKY